MRMCIWYMKSARSMTPLNMCNGYKCILDENYNFSFYVTYTTDVTYTTFGVLVTKHRVIFRFHVYQTGFGVAIIRLFIL